MPPGAAPAAPAPGPPGPVAPPGDPGPADPVAPPPPERPVPEVWEGTFAYEEVQEEDEGRRTVVRHLLVLTPRGDGTYGGRYDVSGDVEPFAVDVTAVVQRDALLVRRADRPDVMLLGLYPPPEPDRPPLTRWGAATPLLHPAPPGLTEGFVRVG